jgi:D-aminoacyl-tRNA deacylase
VKLALWTREDPASQRAARALIAQGRFAEEAGHPGLRLDRAADAVLFEVQGSLLAADYADRRVGQLVGRPISRSLFLSKHSAASKIRSFTVHPIGNPGAEASFGGRPRTLCPPDPEAATALLAALTAEAPSVGSSASFESTHHGPLMESPSAFVEVGSSAPDWENEGLCQALARAVEAAWMALPAQASTGPCALGAGGGHYHPKHSDRARHDGQPFGHLIPDYALEEISDALLDEALRQSRAQRVLVDARHMKAAHKARVEAAAARAGVPVEPV